VTGLKGPHLPETAVRKMFMRVCGCSACAWALRLSVWSVFLRIAAPPCRLPILDATYYANAHVLLHDDTCFRFAYKRNDTATIQMMDLDKTEVSPGARAHGVCLAVILGLADPHTEPPTIALCKACSFPGTDIEIQTTSMRSAAETCKSSSCPVLILTRCNPPVFQPAQGYITWFWTTETRR